MKMKILFSLFLTLIALPVFAGNVETKTYGLHLFFDEKEFIDVLTITRTQDGKLSGHMYVPNDFAGEVSNLRIVDGNISFELFVPKNSARPQDLIFTYKGRFFDQAEKQMTGFVTLENQADFVASFVAFSRE